MNGIYGGTITFCIYGIGTYNPSWFYNGGYLAQFLAEDGDPISWTTWDCGTPQWYFGVNSAHIWYYGGDTFSQMVHDLQNN